MNQFRRLDIDLDFAYEVMRVSGEDIFKGLQTYESRQAAIAATIAQHRLHDLPINSKGKIETWATAYERLCGTKLKRNSTTTNSLSLFDQPASTRPMSTRAGESPAATSTRAAARNTSASETVESASIAMAG